MNLDLLVELYIHYFLTLFSGWKSVLGFRKRPVGTALIRRWFDLRIGVGVWVLIICCFVRDRSQTVRLRSSVVIVKEMRVA